MSGFSTFRAPHRVTGSAADVELGRAMVAAWRRDGIFQIAADAEQRERTRAALAASRRFFAQPLAAKAACVNDLSYSGYIASGEEETAGERDASEIFTITPDLPGGGEQELPCHGPVPWPGLDYRAAMETYLDGVGSLGDRLLPLVALGLGLESSAVGRLADLTRGGWHHMRVLRFPPASATTERGIGAHTDYGLLVIAAQDEVGGLYVRPPVRGERRPRNWLPDESTAGFAEDASGWRYVPPVPGVLTVFPGDILQFLTGGALLSTPHRVRLADRERFTLAYFHEPRFDARIRPLLMDPYEVAGTPVIHYGEHFTRMFMRCYPQRATTRRIERAGLLRRLAAAR
ncbi:MFS transporter [Streptomyces sp. NBC_00249]|uniref:2-oxoglutarate and iron-dependent oxygenase domain-containing protein n=1 Tax=Streptomyces sp. NBC_00249 TaxID=2975690 RepID=UPI002252E5CD|nr:2-oxoglutarate and iron-dependent oxygenase domain-containing protein [Streptomyces sp. NBC_00249]MCX5195168.1 MFS transporter [Streptomyces sp. NBC_00249]